MRTQPRVRGLQDIVNSGDNKKQNRMGALNRLAQLQREKERIKQERSNWQEKIDLINARLEQIGEQEAQLKKWLVEEEDPAPDARGGRKGAGREIAHKEMPVDEVTVIRY